MNTDAELSSKMQNCTPHLHKLQSQISKLLILLFFKCVGFKRLLEAA